MINYASKNIIETRKLDFEDVRQLCIDNNWYTHGDCNDYSAMLEYVQDNSINPAGHVIYSIAMDIYKHSRGEDEVSDIMFKLGDLVRVSYEIGDNKKGRYEIFYNGHLFHGDADRMNTYVTDDTAEVRDLINHYGDDPNTDLYIIDSYNKEAPLRYYMGEWEML